MVEVTDELDHTTTVDYDLFGRPLEMVEPLDEDAGEFITTPAPVYDGNDNVVISTAPNGAVTATDYDAADRPVEITLPEDGPDGPQRVATVGYDLVGNVTSQTEPLGNLPGNDGEFVTQFVYDEVYQLTSVTDAEGNQSMYSYDRVGNLVEETDARGHSTGYAYDLNGRLVEATDAAGHTVATEYDLDGLVTGSVDQEGVRTETVYDQRGMVAEVHSSQREGVTRVVGYKYDQVGNPVKVISPRGSAGGDPDAFVQETVYDELNRPVQEILPYDPGDPDHDSADSILYEYDQAGRVTTVSAPPSEGQAVRNGTGYSYLDTGWVQTSTSPSGIVTGYDYNVLGQQTGRTLTSAGESSDRTMTWDYLPDGKLAARSDDGVPVGLHVVLVDNADLQNVTVEGDWATGDTGQGLFGFDYATHTDGDGQASFGWALNIPADGSYHVFARWPQLPGAATDAAYTIEHDDGDDTVLVDQSQQHGQWVSLGSYQFVEGNDGGIALSGDGDGTVTADAVKLVRDTSGEPDAEGKDVTYDYDANGNLAEIVDGSSGAAVDAYSVGYDGLNRVVEVEELLAGAVENTTSYTYNEVGAPLTRSHDNGFVSFSYDARNLLVEVANADSASDPDPKITGYTYTPRGQQASQTKANGNTVELAYWLDGSLRQQTETKPDATVVAEHTYQYDLNGNRAVDSSRLADADNPGDYLERDTTFDYDPRDRIAQAVRTDPDTGEQVGSETYLHDANNNIVQQTIDGVTTSSVYDRNRLQTSTHRRYYFVVQL